MMFEEETSWTSKTRTPGKAKELTFFLPGILARADEQFAPLESAFRGSHVCTVDFVGSCLNAEAMAEIVARYVNVALRASQRVHIVGVSLGGVFAPLIVQRVTASKENLRVTIVDSPAGVETLSAIPPFAGSVARWLFNHLRPGPVTNKLYGNRVIGLMSVPPKRENIEVPAGENLERYQDAVIAKAKASLSGHTFSMWWSQLAFMSKNDVPYEALADVSDVTYMWCGLGEENANDVVRQTQAVLRWTEHLPALESLRVESTHAGFLEKQPTWLKAFSQR